DGVRLSRGIDGFGQGPFGEAWEGPEELRYRVADVFIIFDAHVVRAPSLQVDFFHYGPDLAGLISSPGIDQKLAVQIKAHAVIGHRAELVLARFRRRELASPANREAVFIYFGRGSAATPIEIDLLVGSD